MEKLSAAFMLLIIATAVPFGRAQGVFRRTRVSASASVVSRGGSATALVIASSEAFAEAESEMIRYFETVFSKADDFPEPRDPTYCPVVRSAIDEDLSAVGLAVAEAYASAIAEVDVKGEGEACADAEASARAQARAFASVVAKAIVQAENDISIVDATAEADARIDVVARAFARAIVSICAGSDSRAFALQETIASAVIEAVASVALSLLAETDCTGMAEAVVEIIAETSVSDETIVSTDSDTMTEGNAEAEADGDGEATTAVECTGVYRNCCRWFALRRDRCNCSPWGTSSGSRCDAVKRPGNPTIWMDSDADILCFC